MTFEEIYNQLPGNGWLTVDEAELLHKCCLETKGPILEVGCYKGRSTVLLAQTRKGQFDQDVIDHVRISRDLTTGPRLNNYFIHCVDPFYNFSDEDPTGVCIQREFWHNLLDRHVDNVRLYSTKIEDWQPIPMGMCYLDGDHTFLGTMVQISKALQCKPTMIAIHDVNDSGGGAEVKRAAVQQLGQWLKRVGRLAVWEIAY